MQHTYHRAPNHQAVATCGAPATTKTADTPLQHLEPSVPPPPLPEALVCRKQIQLALQVRLRPPHTSQQYPRSFPVGQIGRTGAQAVPTWHPHSNGAPAAKHGAPPKHPEVKSTPPLSTPATCARPPPVYLSPMWSATCLKPSNPRSPGHTVRSAQRRRGGGSGGWRRQVRQQWQPAGHRPATAAGCGANTKGCAACSERAACGW